MNKESQTRLADIHTMLTEATRLNENGQHGAALKQAYRASEHLAAAYLLKVTGQSLPPNDTTFELFYETIQEPERHPNLLPRIEDVVGDVYVLREAYEPAILNETSSKDAQQMIGHVIALLVLVDQIIEHC
jgi:hypothetical protein